MKSLILADVTSLILDNKLYGHFSKVALLYTKLLRNEYKITIAGSKFYKNIGLGSNVGYCELNFSRKKKVRYNKLEKIIIFIKELLNTHKVLKQNTDILIFQCYSKLPIYLGLIMFKCNANKIYMIEYQPTKRQGLYEKFQSAAMKKIQGIITSSEEVAQYFNTSYIIVPDYFYISENLYCENHILYDFCILGTISAEKMYEDVIESVKNSGLRTIFAGKFLDQQRFTTLKSTADHNTFFIDEYISDEKYYEIMSQSRFVVLPYNPITYKGKSSGVVLDALYHHKPVIAPDFNSFKFVDEKGIGYLYKDSFQEVVINYNKIDCDILRKNIESYLFELEGKNNEFIEFLKKG